MIISVTHALRISELSDLPSDECTWAPELGVGKYCDMHDKMLGHFHDGELLNAAQLDYMELVGLIGLEMSRSDIDKVFRDGLNEKIHSIVLKINGPRLLIRIAKRVGYWFVKWGYYYAVTLRSRFFK